MKKILFILILMIFIPACSGNQGLRSSPVIEASETNSTRTSSSAMTPANPQSSNSPELVTFTTTDGIILAGTLFGEGSTAVILAHQGTTGADQKTWQSFASLLAEHGYTALTFDFRGVGQSEGELLYGDLATDVSAAVQFLQNRGYQKIICVGASMGGTACIRAAKDHKFEGLVILSSTMTAGSGNNSLRLTPDDLKNLSQPKIFISAENDFATVVNDTKHMYDLSPDPKKLLLLPGSKHGTDLFDTEAGEELRAAMLGFVETIDIPVSESLPPLKPISTKNADKVKLLRTMKIPEYQRGRLSQCSLAFSLNGQLLVGACGKNQVPVWDVRSGKIRHLLYDPTQQIIACTFSPDGKTIACGGFDKAVTIWNTSTGEKISSFEGHTAPIWELAFDPSGKSLVSCSLGLLGGGTGSGDVRLWNLPNGEPIWSYAGTRDYLSVTFHPSGETLAYGSIGGSVGILDVASGTLIRELNDSSHNIGDVTYSSSGHWLAAGSDDDQIYLWDATQYKPVARLSGHAGYVNGVAFNAEETLLISGSHDKTVGIWDVAKRNLITLLKGHESEVLRVAFSPDGTLIASISWDGTVRLWGVTGD